MDSFQVVGRRRTGTPGKVYRCLTPGCLNTNGGIPFIRYDPNKGDIYDAICHFCLVPFFHGGKYHSNLAGSAADYSPSPRGRPQHARMTGVKGWPGGKGKSSAKGKGAGKGGKGGKGKGKSKGKDFGKGANQAPHGTKGSASQGARTLNAARMPRQAARRDQLSEKEAQIDKMFTTMQSFFSDLKDFTADKLSVDGFKKKASQVCTQFSTAAKPSVASNSTSDFESAQRAVVHQVEQQRLLTAACTRRFKELQKKLALLQSVTQHHLPEAESRLAEVAAIHHSAIDAKVSSASAKNDEGNNSSATAASASPGLDIGQLNSEIHGSAVAVSPSAQVGGGSASTVAGMSDGSKRRLDTDTAEVEAPAPKLSAPKKAEIEGSALFSAAARGDDDSASDLEDDLDDPVTADPIFVQMMSEAQAQVLTYGPVKARSSEDG